MTSVMGRRLLTRADPTCSGVRADDAPTHQMSAMPDNNSTIDNTHSNLEASSGPDPHLPKVASAAHDETSTSQ